MKEEKKEHSTIQGKYDYLKSDRDQFLNTALVASDLTLPYLVRDEGEHYIKSQSELRQPWQSVGAKGVVTLASKLMLALMPVQTSFFKLQLDEMKLDEQQVDPTVRSEIDLSFAKIERTINEMIAASDDRVVVHQALKHLVVTGNALIFMGKDRLKLFPLNRYVVERDGNGNVLEIVTKERINRHIVAEQFPPEEAKKFLQIEKLDDTEERNTRKDDVDVYTCVKRKGKQFYWYQEVLGKKIPNSNGHAPIEITPWIPLRFNTLDQEPYGRGRVEEFLGDLRSLEALSQAIVEGSAAASKVVFVVSPSSTTKPQTLAAAGNGAIVQGRPDDIGVVQVGKTADFATAQQMITTLERRLSEAFLIMNVRDSERTTAEEVRMTQLELEQQLGGLFSLLTVEFLVPYLNRKLNVYQKSNAIPQIPKDIVKPTIVAGLNALGRGQDRDSLAQFMQLIATTMGPEAIAQYINPEEVIKRLAAAQGIDALNLVKTKEELQAEMAQSQQAEQDLELTKQASQFANIESQQQSGETQGNPQAGY